MIVVGLDLGTCNTVCYVHDGVNPPRVVPSTMGNHTTPSCIAFTGDTVLLGDAAKQQESVNPRQTFSEFKRLMGQRYDPTTSNSYGWLYQITPSADNVPQYTYEKTKKTTPADLTRIMAKHMLDQAQIMVGNKKIQTVVITVPAHYDSKQRSETLNAVQSITKATVQLFNEPTAAGIAYIQQNEECFENGDITIVFDMGAGTLDVTAMKTDAESFTVLGSNGNGHLGGADFDARIFALLKREKKLTTKSMTASKEIMVKAACEQAKRIISTAPSAPILYNDEKEPFVLTRAMFKRAIGGDLAKCTETICSLLAKANIDRDTVRHVIMVGGGSRIPAVRENVGKLFEKAVMHHDISPEECVALGACWLARLVVPVVERLSHSIGVRTGKNIMETMLYENTVLPTEKTIVVHPEHPKQTNVIVDVYQGEDPCTDKNTRLGSVNLDGIGHGRPKLNLTLKAGEDGVLKIEIEDIETGKKSECQITDKASS